MENTNQNPDGCWIKGRKNCRDKRIKTMELEYDSLLKALETRLSALDGSDKSFDWILRCLKKWKRDSCFCQSFEDELSALKECRQIFRDDVLHLKDDVESCHRRCEDQMAVDKQEVIRQKKRCNRIVEKAKAEAKERKKALLCKKTLGLEAELGLRKQPQLNGDEELVREEKMVDKKQEELEQKVTKDKEVVLPKQQSDEIVEQPNAETKETEKSQHRGKRLSLETELKLQALASETAYLDRKQSLLDGEEELLNREEALATGRRQLEELEKVLEETELLLQRRQKMCDRKQEDLINLHEELKELRLGLDSQQSEASDRAQRNWEMLRRELQDRHQLLESNIQKYRTELASASATITGKDIHITKLSQQIADLNRVIEEKDQKIGQLESRLAMALTETVKSDLTHFNQWRNNRGSFRSDSAIDQTSNFSSAEDSLPNSPLKFAPQNPFNHRHSFKANGVNFLNDASERKGYSFASRDEVKVTSPTIERHHHLNGKGEITPTKDKKNSSSACTIM